MLRKPFKKASLRVLDFFFHDEVRLLEVFSAFNIMAWANFFWINPDILTRDSYRGFDGESAVFWAWCFGLIAVVQFASLLHTRWHALEWLRRPFQRGRAADHFAGIVLRGERPAEFHDADPGAGKLRREPHP